jgi:hypothetical protein
MRPVPADKKLVIITGIVAIACGLALGALILWATGRGGSPREYEPFNAGYEAGLRTKLETGGPVFVPDPFGGDQGIWFAIEDGAIVALAVSQPDDPGCAIRWRGSRDTFVDCKDRPRDISALARYDLQIREENGEPQVSVNLQTLLPPPASVPPPQ